MIRKKFLQIAIDGPVASGKGTAAFLLAKKLNLLYVDTGAMYRAAAIYTLRSGLKIEKKNEDRIVALLRGADLEVFPSDSREKRSRIRVNEHDLTEDIRTPLADLASPKLAELPKVRQVLVEKQQEIAKGRGIVMEGRDIGTVVLPQADLKVFLQAPLEERAKRRFREYQRSGRSLDYKVVLERVRERDKKDSGRGVSPLVRAVGAIEIDTTNLSIPEVTAKIEELLKERELI